jgi:hypothetical protein
MAFQALQALDIAFVPLPTPAKAYRLARTYRRSIYDSLYLAVAQSHRIDLGRNLGQVPPQARRVAAKSWPQDCDMRCPGGRPPPSFFAALPAKTFPCQLPLCPALAPGERHDLGHGRLHLRQPGHQGRVLRR